MMVSSCLCHNTSAYVIINLQNAISNIQYAISGICMTNVLRAKSYNLNTALSDVRS